MPFLSNAKHIRASLRPSATKAALAAAHAARSAVEPIQPSARYAPDPVHPRATIELRRIADAQLVPLEFADHRRIETAQSVVLPRACLATADRAEIAALLDRQLIPYQCLTEARRIASIEFVNGPRPCDRR